MENKKYEQYAQEILSEENPKEVIANIIHSRDVNRRFIHQVRELMAVASNLIERYSEHVFESNGKPGYATDEQIEAIGAIETMLRYPDMFCADNDLLQEKLDRVKATDFDVVPYAKRVWK
tara:strand:- start:60 stop:419 length:360 start_codon:yes stop_codon:yes gene_type:complete